MDTSTDTDEDRFIHIGILAHANLSGCIGGDTHVSQYFPMPSALRHFSGSCAQSDSPGRLELSCSCSTEESHSSQGAGLR